MTTAMTTIKKWQDGYVTLITRVEEPVVKFAGKAAQTAGQYVPGRPQWAFFDQVPTVTELVDSQLKFRKRVVDEQAAFVAKMMKAMQPLIAAESKAPSAKPTAAKPSSAHRAAAKAA